MGHKLKEVKCIERCLGVSVQEMFVKALKQRKGIPALLFLVPRSPRFFHRAHANMTMC